MGFAISLRSDNPSADRVRALWQEIRPFEERPSMMLLGYPPHVTLAIYENDRVTAGDARRALDHASKNLRALTLTFDTIRTFDGPPMVLWLSPAPSAILQSIYSAIHDVIDPVLCRSHYRPATWTPHCTLSMQVRVDQCAAALEFVNVGRNAFDVTFDALDCTYFPSLSPFDMRKLP